MKQLWQPIWITVAKKILSEKYAAAGGGGGADLVSYMGDADSHDGQLESAAVPILRCSASSFSSSIDSSASLLSISITCILQAAEKPGKQQNEGDDGDSSESE